MVQTLRLDVEHGMYGTEYSARIINTGEFIDGIRDSELISIIKRLNTDNWSMCGVEQHPGCGRYIIYWFTRTIPE